MEVTKATTVVRKRQLHVSLHLSRAKNLKIIIVKDTNEK